MYTVRRLFPHEYLKYEQHLLSLDTDSRYNRFGHNASDAYISKFCNQIVETADSHVLFCIEDCDLNIIGVGHIALGDEVELAFSVSPGHQGCGIGSSLMKKCVQYCRLHNISKGKIICIQSNNKMKGLCKKFGLTIHSVDGECESIVNFVLPDITTYAEAFIEDSVCAYDYIGKRSKLSWKNFTDIYCN